MVKAWALLLAEESDAAAVVAAGTANTDGASSVSLVGTGILVTFDSFSVIPSLMLFGPPICGEIDERNNASKRFERVLLSLRRRAQW